MNYFTPGLQEILRQGERLIASMRLRTARRKREQALTELGLLAWQQADFDERTQQQVDEIQNVERVQSRLMNQAAELGEVIRSLSTERESGRKAHLDRRKQAEQELRKAVESRDQTERQLGAIRKREPNFEKRIPELDRELRDLNRLYSDMLGIEKQTPKLRQEMIRIRERIVAIPNEKSDLRTQHLRTASEVRRLEESLRPQADAVAACEHRLREMDKEWGDREGALQAEIKSKEKEKSGMEKHYGALEDAKTNPYLRIGEVLAGSGIAPLNQPQVLDKVRRLEVQVALLDGVLVDSRAASAAAAGRELRSSLILCLSTALVLILILLVVIF